MPKYVPIRLGEEIGRKAQLLNKTTGEWENYWDKEEQYIPGIANQIFNKSELRQPVKAKSRKSASKYKDHADFCKQKHDITTGHCHMEVECGECNEIWNAAIGSKTRKG